MIKTPWPRFGETPFKKVKLSKEMWFEVLLEYNRARFNDISNNSYFEPEYDAFACDGAIAMVNHEEPFALTSYVDKQKLRDWSVHLQPIAEEWSGKKLRFHTAFGIRSYQKDSILCCHRDNIDTHVISAIIFVDEYPDVKWPLDFIDHEGKHHQVTFEKGDMLLYESLCAHARMTPFPGEFYRNMYFHWAPVDWDYTPYKENKVRYKSIKEVQDEY
jgi:prolyl 4-hydroxylase